MTRAKLIPVIATWLLSSTLTCALLILLKLETCVLLLLLLLMLLLLLLLLMLLLLLQSVVNSEMREIQLNPRLFTLAGNERPAVRAQGQHDFSLMPGAAATEAVAASAVGGSTGSTPAVAAAVACQAALSCASVAKPLFAYWTQLPQHRDMVCMYMCVRACV